MNHIVKITKKPTLSGKQSVPDGALCGNGDLGIILGNWEEGLRIYISKCDLWQGLENHDRGGLKPLGYVDVAVPAYLYENYYVEQDMDKGELRCRFTQGEQVFEIHVRVCKTQNVILLESKGNVSVSPALRVFQGETAGEKGETQQGGIYRIFRGAEHIFETHAHAFLKQVDENRFCAFVATNHDVANPEAYVLQQAEQADAAAYDRLLADHAEAWQAFWAKSAFHTDNRELELNWYASQYFMACCAGNAKFPPGLYANFVTVENPGWHSDYHLNYNYQAPFYAACSSNHVELTDCYHTPLEEFLPKGKQFAEKFGCRGVLYPVAIMPKGICSELTHGLPNWFERLFLGQKSNGIHPANIMIFRWYATRDLAYARDHAYPYLKEALQFFMDWAQMENGVWQIKDDAVHEVPMYRKDFKAEDYPFIHDKNNALTLGLLRQGLPAAIEMAQALGVDDDLQAQWAEFLAHLPPFPTYHRWFQKVFRYTESGQSWNESGDVGLQHIYPCGCVGQVQSDKQTLKIARNTFNQKARYCWIDDNAVSSYFPMAARLGMNPKRITKQLLNLNKKKQLPNLLYNFGGGCLENCVIFASTLNEMVLQSFEGVVRLFPCWDFKKDVSFENLRANGAFLVSAEVKKGEINHISIVSEMGETLCLENPFPSAVVTVDGVAKQYNEKVIHLPTRKGSVITVGKGA